MTNPYRAMCAELADVVYEYCILHEGRDHLQPLVDRARALMDQQEPEGPTDEEPVKTASDAGLCYPVCWDLPENEMQMKYLRNFARAVLTKWGCPTPQPVPLSERLPGPEDCDEQGRCWWHRYTPTKEWHLQRVYIGRYNYWLPAHALPTPEAQ